MPQVRTAWLARLFGAGLALYLRLVVRTCRVIGPAHPRPGGAGFLARVQHATFIVARKRRGDLPHASFSTIGFRGTAITSMLMRSGTRVGSFELPPEERSCRWPGARAPHGGAAEAGASLIVTPDGPFGPYRVAKPGALILARASGTADPAVGNRRFGPRSAYAGRWDRQLVPLPFCRIRIIEGRRFTVATSRARARPGPRQLEAELDRISGRPRGLTGRWPASRIARATIAASPTLYRA